MVPIEEIYNNYYTDLYRYVFALSKNAHIAEDITQETFMKAIKAVDRFKGDCDIREWLCQIAKNTYLPFREIAVIFGKTESWARVTYHRARLLIMNEMEELS